MNPAFCKPGELMSLRLKTSIIPVSVIDVNGREIRRWVWTTNTELVGLCIRCHPFLFVDFLIGEEVCRVDHENWLQTDLMVEKLVL